MNTSGLVAGPGIALKRAKIDALDPSHVVAIQQGRELEPVLKALPAGRVHRLRPSSAARAKSSAVRRVNRVEALGSALLRLQAFAARHLVIEELLRSPPPAQTLRLCCFADAVGEDRAIGIFRSDFFAEQHCVWAPCDTQPMRRARLGMPIPPELLVRLVPPAVAARLLSPNPFRELNQPVAVSAVEALLDNAKERRA